MPPNNNKLVAPSIQKDITNACAVVTTRAIISELDNKLFAMLVDEAHNVSNKEQMAVALRYVDKKGCVLERFIGIVHVSDTTAISLKTTVESLLTTYGLSITRIRGQGYDGASNMQGEFSGLKSIILAENQSAYYVHCFAHQLQLTLVAVAKNHQKLGITNELSQALQRKDHDLINAMVLVKSSKVRFQDLRENRLESLFKEIDEFCNKNSISIPRMEDIYIARGRSRRRAEEITNKVYYRTTLFYTVIDAQIMELNVGFNEVNTGLLLCMHYLNPSDYFSAFDKRKIIRFAEFYPAEFSATDLILLDNQLQNYIVDVKDHTEFFELKGISNLARKLVETKKNAVYPFVYCLVKLALILPIATVTVERAFSAMKIVK